MEENDKEELLIARSADTIGGRGGVIFYFGNIIIRDAQELWNKLVSE